MFLVCYHNVWCIYDKAMALCARIEHADKTVMFSLCHMIIIICDTMPLVVRPILRPYEAKLKKKLNIIYNIINIASGKQP